MAKQKNIHRGQLLHAAVEATRLNKEEVAQKAGYSRSAYYKHILDKNLPYHILAAYGKAIRYDFTEDLPEMPKYVLEDPQEKYGDNVTLEEAIKQRDQWREKYYELMEKYNKLIEERWNLNKEKN